MRLLVYTSNAHKLREIEGILGLGGVSILRVSDVYGGEIDIIEDGQSFHTNALKKACGVWEVLESAGIFLGDSLVLAEDSGLVVDALDGAPGVYSARYAGVFDSTADEENLNKVITKLKEKNLSKSAGKFVSVIAIKNGAFEKTFYGEILGSVTTTPRGQNGFGYDPIFIPNGFNQTMAELESKKKDAISHRKNALEKLKEFLHRA